MYAAAWEGTGTPGAAAGRGTATVSISSARPPGPAMRRRQPRVLDVPEAQARARLREHARRGCARGRAGSRGTYAWPAFRTPRIAATSGAPWPSRSATRCGRRPEGGQHGLGHPVRRPVELPIGQRGRARSNREAIRVTGHLVGEAVGNGARERGPRELLEQRGRTETWIHGSALVSPYHAGRASKCAGTRRITGGTSPVPTVALGGHPDDRPDGRSLARRRRAPEPPRFGRWRFPLRVHIATLFVALIAAAGLAIVGYGYRATSGLLLSAGDEEFLQVAEHTAGQVRNVLAPARLLVDLLARHPLTRTGTLAARRDALPLLTAALARHPEISAVYVGFGSGDFFLVRSLSAAVRRGLDAPGGGLPGSERGRQGRARRRGGISSWTRSSASSGTTRGRTTGSILGPATGTGRPSTSATLVRTAPYVFFTTREVGTTVAQRSGDGATVVGADITLQALSHHLAQSRVTPSARIALVDRQGFVIAHPDAARLVRPGPGGDPGLTRLGDLGDPALERLLAASDGHGRDHAEFSLEGRAWVGLARPIEVEAGEPVTLLLAAPRDELVAGARGLAQRQLVIGLGVLGLAVGLVWLSARRISRPLETLARSVERIGQGDLETQAAGGLEPPGGRRAQGRDGPDARDAPGPHRGAGRPARGGAAADPGARHRAPDPAVDAPHGAGGALRGAATRSPPPSSPPARSAAISTTSSCWTAAASSSRSPTSRTRACPPRS